MRDTTRRVFLASLMVGLAIGVTLPISVIALSPGGETCGPGTILGWSGPVATPIIVAIPPPGGLVNWSASLTAPPGSPYTPGSDSSAGPVNDTVAAYMIYNWTLGSIKASRTTGFLRSADCPLYDLRATANLGGGCTGCVIAPAVSQGVGQRSVIPASFNTGQTTSVLLNASYPSIPLASFTWSYTLSGGVVIQTGDNLSALFSTVGLFRENGSVVGLGLRVVLDSVGFGVPVMLVGGGSSVYPSGVPEGFPGATLVVSLTYILPLSSEQGTWQVFAAGGSSGQPLGGYLFEQTATP